MILALFDGCFHGGWMDSIGDAQLLTFLAYSHPLTRFVFYTDGSKRTRPWHQPPLAIAGICTAPALQGQENRYCARQTGDWANQGGPGEG